LTQPLKKYRGLFISKKLSSSLILGSVLLSLGQTSSERLVIAIRVYTAMRDLTVAVQGCCHGELDAIYASVLESQRRHGVVVLDGWVALRVSEELAHACQLVRDFCETSFSNKIINPNTNLDTFKVAKVACER
jgi:hypothetical protein